MRIANTKELIDGQKLREQLNAYAREFGESQARPLVLEALKQCVAAGREVARKRLEKNGKGTLCAANISYLQDEIIRIIYDYTIAHAYRATNPTVAERLSIVAVGGYGRGTLAPGSDIDLLFILPYKQTAWGESVVEYMLYLLWDMGFKVGHASRSIDDCIRLSASDYTIRTATLEARFLCGDEALCDEMSKRFRDEILSLPAADFIEVKLAERENRHQKSGESRYKVEPNIKDGKGGLRDLHTLFWIGLYLYQVRSPDMLVDKGLLTREEYLSFKKSEDFLWAIRCHLHFLTGRSEERLTFDHQPEMAKRLGYKERGGMKRVERFMRHYFLVAKDVGDLTRIFCAALEAKDITKAPVLSRFLHRFTRRATKVIPGYDQFMIESGRLNIINDKVFSQDPVNLIRYFYLAGENNVLLHPQALKLITRSLSLVDAKLRRNVQANEYFLKILTSAQSAEVVLRKMNESGVLGRFVPDFGRIVSMMQFNMYHHYTVDEHLLRAVGILAEIERGELADQHPLTHKIIHTIENRRALFVAVFLHDIAKGRPESHSVVGGRIAKKLCPRFGLSGAETQTVVWLIENHLAMSDFAQMRDLNDFKTIMDFAEIVQSPEHLKLLICLTVADIKSVGPGVWNGWKGELLRTLYYEVEPVISGGHTTITRKARLAVALDELEQALADWPHDERQMILDKHYPPYLLNVALERKITHANMIREAAIDPDALIIRFHTDEFTEITEITVFAVDHPSLLVAVTGACAAMGANIVDAQIYTTKDGMALNSIFIQRQFTNLQDEETRAKRIASTIKKALHGDIKLPDLLKSRSRSKSRLKAFSVEPSVIIDNSRSNVFTVIEVRGLDRPGLLFELTNVLFELNINIGSAHISTFGERAVDVFYVKDLTGLKITNEQRHKKIRQQLLSVFERRKQTRNSKDRPARQLTPVGSG